MNRIAIVSYTILSAVSWSCQRSLLPGKGNREVTPEHEVTFSFDAPPQTRTLETTIKDLNIWIYESGSSYQLHYFVQSGDDFSVWLPESRFSCFVLANAGEDLGEMKTTDDLMRFAYKADTESLSPQSLPMSGRAFFVSADKAVSVTLERCVAKVVFRLTVAPDLQGKITGLNVQLMNAPTQVRPFRKWVMEQTHSNYSPRPIVENGGYYTYYVFENNQDPVETITDPLLRNIENAPLSATCIHVAGTYEQKKIDFYFYPGENDTSDFNIFRNRVYIIEATIKGLSETDTRISSWDFDLSAFDNAYKLGKTATSTIMLRAHNQPDDTYLLSCELKKGVGTLMINGRDYSVGEKVPLTTSDGSISANLNYTQATEGNVLIDVRVADKYGFGYTKSLQTQYVPYFPIEAALAPIPEKMHLYFTYETTLTIHEKEYSRDFTVQPNFSGSVLVSCDGVPLNNGLPQKMSAGTHKILISATRIGPVRLEFIINDYNGQRITVTRTSAVVG